jgi:hypothetical protein
MTTSTTHEDPNAEHQTRAEHHQRRPPTAARRSLGLGTPDEETMKRWRAVGERRVDAVGARLGADR